MKALDGRWLSGLERPLNAVFVYFRDSIERAALLDPANSNNNVADELSLTEKRRIASAAGNVIDAQFWSQVLW